MPPTHKPVRRSPSAGTTTRRGNQKIKNAKPKEWNGIKFLSSLEAYTARRLHEEGIAIYYEPFSVEVCPKFTSSVRSMEFGVSRRKDQPEERWFKVVSPNVQNVSYKPDFADAEKLEDCSFILEPKGMATPVFCLRWKLFKARLEQLGLKPRLYLPNNQKQVELVIADIKAHQQLQQQAA